MAHRLMSKVVRELRRAALLPERSRMTDGQLLESFLAQRDETAFEALVLRHGPMVLSVCRRILGNTHDAEDAFQATFLVLVRKGTSVWPRQRVGNWLHGVAARIARKAQTARARRWKHERQAANGAPVTTWEDLPCDDLRPVLDQALERLPDAYRATVVLCDLEGRTKREAAQQLGIPEGTLSSRLARGRSLLRTQLIRRGVTLSLTSLTLLLAQQAASAGIGAPLIVSTVRAAALLVAAGQTAGAVSARVALLTEGMVKAMMVRRVLTAVVVILALGLVGLGIGVGAYRTFAVEPETAKTSPEARPEQERSAAVDKERVPPAAALTLALVSLDDKGRLVVRCQMPRLDGSDGLATQYYNTTRVQAYEGGGKTVSPQVLTRRLKQEVLAFVAHGPPRVDPQYLRLIKEGTLVFVLPEPEPEAPQPPPVFRPQPPLSAPTPRRGTGTPQGSSEQEKQSSGQESKEIPPADVDALVLNERNFEIPIRIDPASRPQVRAVSLYMSTDRGRTWRQVAQSTPDKDSFRYDAPADGLYWFQVVVTNQTGRQDPADVASTPPGLKIRVQTTKPEPAEEMQAEKDFTIAEFYRRAGQSASAAFYYELVRRRYPGTPFAEKAAERLRELPSERQRRGGGQEKPVARVAQIIIVGNRKTPDHVIRENVPLFPGQVLSYPALRVAEQNLERLNLFRARPRVAVIDDAETSGDYKVILIQVEEK